MYFVYIQSLLISSLMDSICSLFRRICDSVGGTHALLDRANNIESFLANPKMSCYDIEGSIVCLCMVHAQPDSVCMAVQCMLYNEQYMFLRTQHTHAPYQSSPFYSRKMIAVISHRKVFHGCLSFLLFCTYL